MFFSVFIVKEPFYNKNTKQLCVFHVFLRRLLCFKKEPKKELGIIGFFFHCFGVLFPVLFPLFWGSFLVCVFRYCFTNIQSTWQQIRRQVHLRPPLTNTTQKYTLDYYCCYYYLLLLLLLLLLLYYYYYYYYYY